MLTIKPERIVMYQVLSASLAVAPAGVETAVAPDADRALPGRVTAAVEAAVTFSPTPDVGVFAGYRFPEKDAVKCNVLTDTLFDGPYVGALVRF